MRIKMVLTDVDGCLTDGTVIYGPSHEKYKRFNMQDGKAFDLLKSAGILTGVLSGDSAQATFYRAQDLKCDIIEVGMKNKYEVFNKILENLGISKDEVAYMGDDLQDLEILTAVKISSCPNNAVHNIKQQVKYITKRNGGDGAFREFAEYVLNFNINK